MSESRDTEWRKSSFSGAQNSCVEMRRHDGLIEVRDTKDNGNGPTLRFTKLEAEAWFAAVKQGEFDDLA